MPKTARGFLLFGFCLVIAAMLPMAAAPRTAPLIAVLPFDDGSITDRWWGSNWDVGKGISDMIVTELLAQKKFRLAEREMIDKIIREQDLGAGGRVDQKSAAQIGKILGVKYVIIGRVTEFQIETKGLTIGGKGLATSIATVALDGRPVDTTTGEIIASVTGRGEDRQTGFTFDTNKFGRITFGAKDFQESILGKATRAAINEFGNKLTAEIFGDGTGAGLKISGKVAAVSGNKVWLNIGSGDGVSVGMVFDIARVVKEIKDPDTGEIIDTITEDVCQIIIGEVKEATAIGTISSGVGTPAEGDMATQK